ncbi:SDR family oxidoreductase [Bacillus kwashiorkori]|uniref:SDR family oxidoreductase n=1 Tax=Bacillus kwashiorkori TaxID=1522318 RepID=UPI0007832FFE|nr:SDR family oxidoreductase [Bacillus kwashiorkori]
MRLKDKVAVVTGAGSGMGREIAYLFAKEGAKVVAADINETALKETVSHIVEKGQTAIAVVTNVAKEEDIESMINTAVSTYGTLDILVNNAGIMDNFLPAEKVTDEIWDRVFSINVKGVMRAIRKALPIFLEKGKGVIINTASVAGLYGSRAGLTYTSAKHAVIGMTKNVAFQYATKGIRCNAIAPGGVNTNIGTTMSNPDPFGMERATAGINANPRMGESSEIATIALFLATEDSSYVNGVVIAADGGWTAY